MRGLLAGFVVVAFIVPSIALADPAADFKARCSPCHEGSVNMQRKAKFLKVEPKQLNLRNSKLNRDEMIAVIGKGRGPQMPGFEKKLTKQRIADLVDYLMALNKGK